MSNREIKFRAWDKEKERMRIFGRDSNNTLILAEVTETNKDWTFQWQFGEADYDWGLNGCNERNGILMQFTGLKDKNGKDIYEGDILDNMMVVIYYGCGFKLCHISEFNKYNDYDVNLYSLEPNNPTPIQNTYRIVTGNVYENPELLEGK